MYCIFINLRILNINNLFHDCYIKHHRENMSYITFCDVTFLHESKSFFTSSEISYLGLIFRFFGCIPKNIGNTSQVDSQTPKLFPLHWFAAYTWRQSTAYQRPLSKPSRTVRRHLMLSTFDPRR